MTAVRKCRWGGVKKFYKHTPISVIKYNLFKTDCVVADVFK